VRSARDAKKSPAGPHREPQEQAAQIGGTRGSLSGQGGPSLDQRKNRPGGYQYDDAEEK